MLHRVGLIVAALGASACASTAGRSSEPPPANASRSAPMPMESVEDQMHGQFEALKKVQEALIQGDLAAARQHGAVLQQLTAEGVLGTWEQRMRFVRARADLLVAAQTPAEARHIATDLATYCADCHMVEADEKLFAPGPQPVDDGTVSGRMARHAWAANALWLAIIAPSEDPWREGLEVFAEPPPPPELISADPARHADYARLGSRLTDLARRSAPLPGQGDRAEAFADIIDVCAACHAISRPR